jgi:hypothetical protein
MKQHFHVSELFSMVISPNSAWSIVVAAVADSDHNSNPRTDSGQGPACAAVRCTSVLVTGDMLVHAQL